MLSCGPENDYFVVGWTQKGVYFAYTLLNTFSGTHDDSEAMHCGEYNQLKIIYSAL